MNIEPIGNRVVIAPIEKNSTERGIILTKQEEEKQDQGRVVSVGDGAKVEKFKRGNLLIYQKYGPAEVTIGERPNIKKYVIVHIDEILGRIK